jgi:drug/metabolite transporter (DMT)-like permease
MSDPHSQLDSRAVLIMIALCLAWGLQSVAMKVAIAEVAPVFQAAIRSIGAAVLILVWVSVRRIQLFERDGTLWPGVIAGLLFAGEFLLLFWGLEYTTASRAILFLYTSPFVVALGAHLFVPAERLDRVQVIGLVCAFAGVALAFGDGLRLPTYEQVIGDAMVLTGAVLWGATTVVIKATRLARAPAVKTLAYQLIVSALALPLASLALAEPWPVLDSLSSLTLISILYQTVGIAFISYLIWFWLVRSYPAARLAAFSFLTPLFGMVAAGVLLGDPLTPALLAALILVAAGIRLVNRPQQAAVAPRSDARQLVDPVSPALPKAGRRGED